MTTVQEWTAPSCGTGNVWLKPVPKSPVNTCAPSMNTVSVFVSTSS